MSHHSSQILKDALSLPAAERIALAERLSASLDSPARRDVDGLWSQESGDRIDAFEQGEIATIAAKDLFGDTQKR